MGTEVSEKHSPEYWIDRWNASVAESALFRKQGYMARRVWDGMADTYGHNDSEASRTSEVEALISMLSRKGLFFEGAHVLDVGCGTGRMTIPFAESGALVTALDFSKGMLDRLKGALSADAEGRVDVVEKSWPETDLAEFGWEKRFDLVFAHMTPAVSTPETFIKLMSASRGGCFFRGWVAGRRDFLVEKVWLHLTGAPMPPRGWDIMLAFNLLRSMDLSPEIEFRDISWEREESVDKAARFFTGFFHGIVDDSENVLHKRITAYLETIARKGLVTKRTEGRTGAMVWRVE